MNLLFRCLVLLGPIRIEMVMGTTVLTITVTHIRSATEA
jgi:hypothetical protein